jgi:hypothetical protein
MRAEVRLSIHVSQHPEPHHVWRGLRRSEKGAALNALSIEQYDLAKLNQVSQAATPTRCARHRATLSQPTSTLSRARADGPHATGRRAPKKTAGASRAGQLPLLGLEPGLS